MTSSSSGCSALSCTAVLADCRPTPPIDSIVTELDQVIRDVGTTIFDCQSTNSGTDGLEEWATSPPLQQAFLIKQSADDQSERRESNSIMPS